MRTARYTLKGEGYYYVRMEPLVGRIRLTEKERDYLMNLAARASRFTGVEVLECVVLPTGIQMVVRADPRKKASVDTEELRARYHLMYGNALTWRGHNAERMEQVLAQGGEKAEAAREGLLTLMEDVSQMMKIVKQRYCRWYNRRHRLRGPLWVERYQSVLLEPEAETVGWFRALVQSAPVRAGEATRLQEYRWSTAAVEGWQGKDSFLQRSELQEWTDKAVEDLLPWMLESESSVEEIEEGRCPPEELEDVVVRRVMVGSEDFVRHHHLQWLGSPKATRVNGINLPLWGARTRRRHALLQDPEPDEEE